MMIILNSESAPPWHLSESTLMTSRDRSVTHPVEAVAVVRRSLQPQPRIFIEFFPIHSCLLAFL